MSDPKELARYYEALSKAMVEWDRLLGWARQLGLSDPTPSSAPAREAHAHPMPRRRVRRHHEGPSLLHTTPAGPLTTLSPGASVEGLSRPDIIFKMLKAAGRPASTGEIVLEFKRLGLDVPNAAGGMAVVVSGPLYRMKSGGVIRRLDDGRWELVNRAEADTAAASSSDGNVQQFDAHRAFQRGTTGAEVRRQVLLGLFGTDSYSPGQLILEMRKIDVYRRTTRSSVRDDLDHLIADGKVEKSEVGKYRRVVAAKAD